MVFSCQVHGDTVRVCTAADAGSGLARKPDYEADGLITDVPGLCLVVFSADCLPILLHDPVRRVVAAVHAGWRGTANGIVERACEKMRDLYGCRSEDIRAAIGPGISRCCFETGEDVPNAMTSALGFKALEFIDAHPGGKFRVDLKGINAFRLRRQGLTEDHIAVSPDCTVCLHDKYWSHRFTKGERGKPGGGHRPGMGGSDEKAPVCPAAERGSCCSPAPPAARRRRRRPPPPPRPPPLRRRDSPRPRPSSGNSCCPAMPPSPSTPSPAETGPT